ncbi:MAG TPA: hypothetical protein VFG54_08390 [Prolixibacteraceae bacterium]|nr:hypothetical protein [Prolixibacteraceae bacterium]
MKTNRTFWVVLLVFWLSFISKPVIAWPFARKTDSIQVIFDENQLVLPGESFRIGVTSYYKNGKVKNTTGLMGGSVWWWKYKVEVAGGTNLGGRITVSERLVPSLGKYIGIKVYPRRQPALMKEMLIPLNYETKIIYRPVANFDKAPGSHIKGELYTEFDNGISRVCENLRNSRESDYFKFTPRGGRWEAGKFIIDPDFMNIEAHRASLVVSSLRNRSLADTFAVLMDYKHTYDLHLRGERGSAGFSGINGHSGSNGSNGTDGLNGGDGGHGSDGPEVGVWVDLYHDSILQTDLLYVYAQNLWNGQEYRYLVNPDGGRLEVSSEGGDGGRGGDGGNGGSGGQGWEGERWIERHIEKQTISKPVVKKVIKKRKRKTTDATGKEVEHDIDVEVEETVYVNVVIDVVVEEVKYGPGGPGGNGGWGGAGGLGGQGGYGGNISLYFTPDAWQYQHVISARSDGGSGGANGDGGRGGPGGSGGHGNPNGRVGSPGQSGPEAMGWADSGGRGKITVGQSEEFFFYSPKIEASGMERP